MLNVFDLICILVTLSFFTARTGMSAPFEDDKGNIDKGFGGQSEESLQAVQLIIKQLEEEMSKEHSHNSENITNDAILFEGDIMLTPEEAEKILVSSRSRKKRKINADVDKRWPLPIPYRFSDNPKYILNSTERAAILDAITELSSLTCITFIQVNVSYPTKPILDFRKDVGCWSYVGREKAFQYQEVSTANGCFEKGVLLHELGHTIGFWHEQSRPDRDAYVTYLEENVKRGEEFNFKRETWGDIDNMAVPYDVGSIMHYGSSFFSRNGLITLETKDPLLQRDLGQRQAMSFYDVKLANLAYCKDACPPATFSCLHDGYPDPKDCSRCRCPDGLSGSRCQYAAQPVGANCGGPLYVDNGARYTIRSPGYPWAYMGNTQCSWLFQARPGMRLFFDVKPENFMRHPDCPKSNVSVCSDYLEVKYNLSFGFTGARFCCGQVPRQVIVSSGNTMLVLFRASQNGIGGFSADVYTEPCGGCFKSLEPQKPCHTSQTVLCRQEWFKMEYIPCPVLYRPPTYVCNKYVPRKHSRDSTCEVEKEECCNGSTLKDGYCIPNDQIGSTTESEEDSSATTNGAMSSTQVTPEPASGWGEWSSWSTCTATCGGCGKRGRTRACIHPHNCRAYKRFCKEKDCFWAMRPRKIEDLSGQNTDSQMQVCNTEPCPNYQAYACPHITVEEYNCGWLINCTRTKSEMRQCVTRCCPNYEDKNGVCQPVNSKRKRKRRK